MTAEKVEMHGSEAVVINNKSNINSGKVRYFASFSFIKMGSTF